MIVICTPTRDTVQAGFAYDLVQLIQQTPDSSFSISQGTFLCSQRTELVKRCIEAHVSHVMFIDSDMRFPANSLARLLAHKAEIVGANYKHRQSAQWTAGISSEGKKGLEEVETMGFGVSLIRTDVFFKVPKPWFATPYDGEQLVSDDVFFCYKAKEAGFKILIDHDLSQEIKHTGSYDFGI